MTEKIAKTGKTRDDVFSSSSLLLSGGNWLSDTGLSLGGGAAACEVMTTPPDAKTHKMMGKYDLEAAATAAMATMKECGG